jgi:hypothetical protein
LEGSGDPNPWVSRNTQDIHMLGDIGYIQVWYKPGRWKVTAGRFLPSCRQ